ncbi:MAG: SCF ubiquitin ligase complex subunit cdc4 [Stictis urceolatum]|nr:SCF ubiquitin ligase complex subunit cdc4 [Stictis urceolata]
MDAFDTSTTNMKAPPLRREPDAYSPSHPAFTTTKTEELLVDAIMNDPFEQNTVASRPEQMEKEQGLDTILGEFSFAPTTETTVYTTKVVKTINFPPLIMKGPKHLHDLDPKLYPLAASPTPSALKNFCFDVGGKPTMFREAEYPDLTLQEVRQPYLSTLFPCSHGANSNHQIREQSRQLQASGGRLSSRKECKLELETPQRINAAFSDCPQTANVTSSLNPPASPSRILPGVRTRSAQASSSKPTRVSRRHAASSQAEIARPSKSSSRLQYMQTSTPITPSVNARTESGENQEGVGQQGGMNGISLSAHNVTPDTQGREFPQTLSPQPELNMERYFSTDDSFSTLSDDIINATTATPPIEQSSQTSFELSGGPQFRPRPSALDTAVAQDVSLPSPSLSPVTAAANLQSRRSYFDDPGLISRRSTDGDGQTSTKPSGLGLFKDGPLKNQVFASMPSGQHNPATLMDVPRMLDTFEAMPTDMQRYVMFQLLRRCPKPVLHSVADTVNPALKCDFLALLPAELSHIIVGNLDLKSLCRGSQVSKKWRQTIDSDEKVWKNLFLAAGYELGQDEMRRAILEGWGWQPWSSLGDSEEDLGNFDTIYENLSSPVMSIDSQMSLSAPVDPPPQPSSSRRTKRKAGAKLRTSSRKASKKKETSTDDVVLYDVSALTRHIESAEGPYAAAKAAVTAIPTSQIGLESLRSLTLYKNIYRRHHLISASWMQDEIQPRHLAFKAHSRHVVTCLQFDADKILTGSDDTNINVYDTKTGMQRAKLTGHEGGVWALQYVGNTLVSGSTDRSVRVWDIERGVCTHVFHGHTSTVRCLIILMPTVIGKTSGGRNIVMPKEPMVITGSRDSTLRVWKLPKQGEASPRVTTAEGGESPYFCRALTGHMHSVRAIAAHGDTLVSGSYDCTVRVWKISTGETLHRLSGHAAKVYSVVLDHERNRCISGSMDNLVKVWSLDTGSVLYNLEGHSSLVGLLDLQRDRLVSAAADSTLRIWDPVNGQCKSILSAHTGAITCFQHDGEKVVSGSDRNLKMWNIQTGEFVRDLLTDLSGVWQVNFDERRCVAAVQRNNLTYIEILDFGASRDGVSVSKRGRRIVVDTHGKEINEPGDADTGDE